VTEVTVADEAKRTIPGIHHVTAIAGTPQENLDFYTSTLGLRFVKKTVNFDDPTTYHFYYGDSLGHPGTIFTFFPWPGAQSGRGGAGMAVATAFSVPEGSLGRWMERLAAVGVPFDSPTDRFDTQVLRLTDPHGTQVELVPDAGVPGANAPGSEPASQAGPTDGIAPVGFHGVTLAVAPHEGTNRLLSEVFGYEWVGEEAEGEGSRIRFRAPGGAVGSVIDLVTSRGRARGVMGAGAVHHVAFRAKDAAEQIAWRETILEWGLPVTPVQDRQYFTSIYFREPGGVLFEIATDPPGFTLDETAEELGTGLRLPPWLEPRREWIAERLPKVRSGR
jgi:glyoxalase family protein